jgi:hypothetical protein
MTQKKDHGAFVPPRGPLDIGPDFAFMKTQFSLSEGGRQG